MPNYNYNRGADLERKIKALYEKKNYFCIRTAGSHSVCDLIAFNENETVLIQCKSSRVEDLPDVKQLLKPTMWVKDKKVNAHADLREGHRLNFNKMEVQKEVPSNVKLLEELKVPLTTKKLIVWKGTGTNNYYTFSYVATYTMLGVPIVYEWRAMKGLPI